MAITGQTPNSGCQPYATGDDMVIAFDWRQLADLVADPTTRAGNVTPPQDQGSVLTYFAAPTVGALGTQVGYVALCQASGMVEAAVTRAARFDPADLLNMLQPQIIPAAQGGDGVQTAYTNGRFLLVEMVCGIAYFLLATRRKPGFKIEDVPKAAEAFRLLELLERGERVLPFRETQQAGLPEESPIDSSEIVRAAAVPVSVQMHRLFGSRGGRAFGGW